MLVIVFIAALSGCKINTYGFSEEQQRYAEKKYCTDELLIYHDDSVSQKTIKVFGRILVFPVTLCFSEILIAADRDQAYKKYLQLEFEKSFVSKHESDIIAAFGVPSRICEDGLGGKILVYETTLTSSSKSRSIVYGNLANFANVKTVTSPTKTMVSSKQFFVGKDGICYHYLSK